MKDIKKGDTLYALQYEYGTTTIGQPYRVNWLGLNGDIWFAGDDGGLVKKPREWFSTTPRVSKGDEDPLSDFTIPEFSDGDYHGLYDKLGHNYFGNPSDDRLRELGKTLGEIYRLRIDSVKRALSPHKTGIGLYMLLCEIRENKPRPSV